MKIYKYRLEIIDQQFIEIPTGARILHVGIDPAGQLCLWALVNETAVENTMHQILIYGTGQHTSNYCQTMRHLGSVTMGQFVWHVFHADNADLEARLQGLEGEVEHLEDRIRKLGNPDYDY